MYLHISKGSLEMRKVIYFGWTGCSLRLQVDEFDLNSIYRIPHKKFNQSESPKLFLILGTN